MKLEFLIFPYVDYMHETGFNCRLTQAEYFCHYCKYFEDRRCEKGRGNEINRYVCAKFKKYKLKKL